MAKANLTLPNGTVVNIEGTPEEVHRLIELNSAGASPRKPESAASHIAGAAPEMRGSDRQGKIDLVEIVNLVRTCDLSTQIEKIILDKTNVLNRVLLPLFVVHEYKANAFGLTSGDLNKITVELGVPVAQPDASRCLSGPAKGYVVGDKMRVKGQPVRYRLTRRGVQYLRELLAMPSVAKS